MQDTDTGWPVAYSARVRHEDSSFAPSRALERAFRLTAAVCFLPSMAIGAITMFAPGEHSRMVRGILWGVSLLGLIGLLFVKRWYERERDAALRSKEDGPARL